MARSAKEIVSRLGPEGLGRALDDLLDQSHLVRLANSCGIKYRGMRTQSQSRERLLGDLVGKARSHEAARKAIVRVLTKESAAASRDWTTLAAEEKTRRLSDEKFLLSNGNLGLHLYLLASQTEGLELDGFGDHFARQALVRIATNGGAKTAHSTRTDRVENRLRRNVNELEKKVRHSEGQLAKSRETQKTLKRDLIQRKGDLAESRMLVERLRRELAQAQAAAQVATAGIASPAGSDKALADVTKAVRKLAADQRKLTHGVEKLQSRPAQPNGPSAETLESMREANEQLKKELARQRQESKKALAAQIESLETLKAEVIRAQKARATHPRPAKKARPKGQAKRVGVFIDVQNMYYAARQLKGKLDFDALLQAAVRDRRLIQAAAYVVESKETDQSQFIAMLQQRAIEVQRKTVKVRADGSMKGDWDMELALDILDAAPKLDVVVLVSGDGDFTSLVKRVKKMGPRVEVIAFPRNTAKALLEAADKFQPLDRKFMIYPKRPKTAAPAPKRPTGSAGPAAPKPASAAAAAGPAREKSKAQKE